MFAARCLEDIQPVKFTYYTPEDRKVGKIITRTTIPSNFDYKGKTTFIAPGWRSSVTDDTFVELTNVILDAFGGGVILIDWSGASHNPDYVQAAPETLTVAKEVSLIMGNLMAQYNLPNSMFQCVGHSLGGQICGRAGNYLKLGEIFALDPAGPDFIDREPSGRLCPESADFVTVVHSAAKGLTLNLGMFPPCGHVDFYPNGGGNQPDCKAKVEFKLDSLFGLIGSVWDSSMSVLDDITDDVAGTCSHFTSVRLFVESLKSSKCVSRQKCTDYASLPRSCSPATVTPLQVIGHAREYDARGIFYLTTNQNAPYCQG
jgi:hypothetical protein